MRPDLSAATVAVLLWGWSAHPPAPDLEPRGFDGGFIDLYSTAGIVRLWRTHEPYLRATAGRWGWSPRHVGPDGRARFFGEHAAAGLPA